MAAMGCSQKSFYASVVETPAPSQRPLAPSVKSVRLVANDEGDNEMIPETVHRSPGIFLTAEENLS